MTTIRDVTLVRQPKPKFPILGEISKRWSPRYFSDKTIPISHLNRIFEAARWAPSARHHQPWYFYYTKKGTASYKKLFSTLNAYNQSWAGTAPLLILACAIARNQYGENPFAQYDLSASVLSLILQAQSLGYYARQMGLFDKEKVKTFFHLKSDLEPFVVITLGRIGDYRNAPKRIIEMELDPRPRKTDFFQKM